MAEARATVVERTVNRQSSIELRQMLNARKHTEHCVPAHSPLALRQLSFLCLFLSLSACVSHCLQAQEGEPPGEVDAMIVLIAAVLIFQLTMSMSCAR